MNPCCICTSYSTGRSRPHLLHTVRKKILHTLHKRDSLSPFCSDSVILHILSLVFFVLPPFYGSPCTSGCFRPLAPYSHWLCMYDLHSIILLLWPSQYRI